MLTIESFCTDESSIPSLLFIFYNAHGVSILLPPEAVNLDENAAISSRPLPATELQLNLLDFIRN